MPEVTVCRGSEKPLGILLKLYLSESWIDADVKK
jgi:hypothetical protein